jgi:hypothetical protein
MEEGKVLVTVAKPWWKSRIIWIQVLSLLASILTYIVDNAKPFGVELPPNAPGYVLMFVGVLNLVTLFLRTQTNQPVDNSGSATPVPLRIIDSDGDAKKVA